MAIKFVSSVNTNTICLPPQKEKKLTCRNTAVKVVSIVVRFSLVDDPEEKLPGDPPENVVETEGGTNGDVAPTIRVLELM